MRLRYAGLPVQPETVKAAMMTNNEALKIVATKMHRETLEIREARRQALLDYAGVIVSVLVFIGAMALLFIGFVDGL